MSAAQWSEEVIGFWFGALEPKHWFVRHDWVDDAIRERFLGLHEEISGQSPVSLVTAPRPALAAVIVLDQFPRNLFRGTARAFATDAQALDISQRAIAARLDQSLSVPQRTFLYMPFQHAEDSQVQERSIELFESLGDAEVISFARRHKEVIDRFGRYPHRNVALGRVSTPEEVEFMETHPGF
jgi:uncharacterized protein (DUF924 family)